MLTMSWDVAQGQMFEVLYYLRIEFNIFKYFRYHFPLNLGGWVAVIGFDWLNTQ